jgi:hypothetical protein
MSAEAPQTPDTQQLLQQLAQQAKENQEIRKIAEQAQQEAKQSQQYMESVKKAATGETNEPKPKPPNEQFLDDVVVHGDMPIRQVVQQELQRKAYLETLQNNFRKQNPTLVTFEDEVFSMANRLISQGQQTGQAVGNDEALKQATEHYKGKASAINKLAGANSSPGGYQGYPTPPSRYEGSDKDYFAMSDCDWAKSPERQARINERKARQRANVAFYGSGR